jgi:hypothetical protein
MKKSERKIDQAKRRRREKVDELTGRENDCGVPEKLLVTC